MGTVISPPAVDAPVKARPPTSSIHAEEATDQPDGREAVKAAAEEDWAAAAA